MRCFQIGDQIVEEQADDFQERLAIAYGTKVRPACLCATPGITMYVARIGDQLLIKRMPLTGCAHDPSCPSYEPPYELSGLGPLIGSAIQVDAASGAASLRLDFSLTKRGPRSAAATETEARETVTNEARKLSLRALLHYLWHEGGLTEWTSHWIGRRHWWQVRSHLIEAARTMTVRGETLLDRLFVPEPFRAEDKTAIEQRRATALAAIHQATSGGQRKLMLLVGEIKEFSQARSGRKVVVKHMPGFPIFLEEGAWRRLQARFNAEFELWQANESAHLMAIMTIGTATSGLPIINEIALMTVTGEWLPVESIHEQQLLDKLTKMQRKSVKGLRFNLPRSQPVATAILAEPKPVPVALYVVPPYANEDFESALREKIEARPDLQPWVWRVNDGDMPDLPPG